MRRSVRRKSQHHHVIAKAALGMRASISSLQRIHQLCSRRAIASLVRPVQLPIERSWLAHRHGVTPHKRRLLNLPQSRSSHFTISDPDEPTIYALSTASGKAAIAVIRISGPACRQVRLLPSRRANHSKPVARSTNACVLQTPFRTLGMPRFASSMRRIFLLLRQRCSTRAPLCSTSQPRTL